MQEDVTNDARKREIPRIIGKAVPRIMEHSEIIAILKDQVKPALGCTEPVAVALAVSRAYQELGGEVHKVVAKLSPNIFKNGMRVGIPGTSEVGIPFAVALGLVCGKPELGLEVFSDVNDSFIEAAKDLESQHLIAVEVEEEEGEFYIEATVDTDQGRSRCVIQNDHTNIVLVEKNGETIFEKPKVAANTAIQSGVHQLGELTIKQLREIIENLSYDDIKFLADGPKLNLNMAEIGLHEKSGLGIGAGLHVLIEKGILEENLINRVRMYTAAATDARMAGVKLPVMSSAGSGNHGITAILPPVIVSQELDCSEERLIRALAFSHLVTIYIKEFTGRLSPICGCAIAAGIGASAAVAWLLGCTDEQIAGAIQNMGGDLTGMICDGAKAGCALKLSAASGEAILAAELAQNNVFISDLEGIVGNNAEATIRNLGRLCIQGMKDVDKNIIDVMLAQ